MHKDTTTYIRMGKAKEFVQKKLSQEKKEAKAFYEKYESKFINGFNALVFNKINEGTFTLTKEDLQTWSINISSGFDVNHEMVYERAIQNLKTIKYRFTDDGSINLQ